MAIISKSGLILSGGGSKGSYQFGILLALKKYGLLEYVQAIAATSIGTLNLLFVCNDNFEKGVDMWKFIDRNDFMRPTKLTNMITKGFGVYSRDGLINIMNENFDLQKVSDSKIEVFVTTTQKNGLSYNKPKYYQLNNLAPEEIRQCILASTAIPVIYKPVIIDGIRHLDGGLVDNEPFTPLIDKKLPFLFLLPLSSTYKVPRIEGSIIIDFGGDIFKNKSTLEGINFDQETSRIRLEKGFEIGEKLIKYLLRDKIIELPPKTAMERLKYKLHKPTKPAKDYYSLSDFEKIV
jgi:NTE family protein